MNTDIKTAKCCTCKEDKNIDKFWSHKGQKVVYQALVANVRIKEEKINIQTV